MKAIVYTEYGPPEVLHLKEVPKPVPKDNEILIRIHAVAVTAGDANTRGFTFIPRGFGMLPRLMFGLTKPRKQILGLNMSGVVEEVGKKVTLFKTGDQVFGSTGSVFGAYAEYVCGHQAVRDELRRGVHVRIRRTDRPVLSAESGEGNKRAEGADQWGVGECRIIRRAARKALWGTRDGRLQHTPPRPGQVARCRCCHRLYEGGFYAER